MNDDVPTCEQVREGALAERYVARTLSPAEEEAFESHYLTCARCQEEVRLAAAVRGTLRQGAGRAAPVTPLPAPGRRRWPRRVAAAGLAAAAGIAALLLARGGGAPPGVARLGGLEQPPVYLGVPVRADSTPANARFEAAMAAYAAGRYADAAAGLQAALAGGVDPAPAEFFRGASLLMLDRPREAAAAFARVAALGPTPYRDEARLYRAKALLRLGRADEAAAELRRVPAGGEAGAWAAALADSLREVERR